MKKYLLAELSLLILMAGCSSSPSLTTGDQRITRVDKNVFFQKLPEAVSVFGGVRAKFEEDRRAAVKQAASYAKVNGCAFIALAGKATTVETVFEGFRANKLRWNGSMSSSPESLSHERAHLVKTPDERVFVALDQPEHAFGSGMHGVGNVWLCLTERGENVTRPELLVNPAEL